jgi:tripeptide aminopeptidase
MVNRDRMVNEFIQLVRIDSLTRNERKMADALKEKLKELGVDFTEDGAGEKIGGNTGNIIGTVKGDRPVPAILLAAHMDTVVPGIGKKPVIEDGYIRSDGTTILGGDDAAGIECILEALRVLKEDGIPHGDIQVAFTVAEEGGLFGSKNLDYSLIYAKYGFVMDGDGPIGSFAVRAPSQNKMFVVVRGKASHAGISPEKGVSAIQIASEAIAGMRLGRIDFETTANIGTINGGVETNIVCERVDIKAEARSRSASKLDGQTSHMRECFERAAQKYGGSVEFRTELEYPSYDIAEDSDVVKILEKAAKSIGIELKPTETGGGSDTNIINGKGIQAVDLSVGVELFHSVEERILIEDLVKAAEFLTAIISNIE